MDSGNIKKKPENGELVVCTITKLYPNSASVRIEEYDNLEGIIPVSEIANTWVKDIRKFVKLGQRLILKVMPSYRDSFRHILTLSYKRVKPTQKKEKMNEWKNEKRARNYFKRVADIIGEDDKKAFDRMAPKLMTDFGNIYNVFNIASKEDGEKTLKEQGIDDKWAKAIVSVAKRNIKEKIIEKKLVMDIKSFKGGIEAIRKSLKINKENIKISYITAPRYQITAKGKNYKDCEDLLASTVAEIEKNLKDSSAEFSIEA